MNVRLRKMNTSEFQLFKKYSIEDYSKDLMKNSEMSLEEAMLQSEKEFAEMLTEGVDTPDNHLMVIEDSDTRKGYATAALYEMEKVASMRGCIECRLYVWKHNARGINLYTKVGYTAFREDDEGMYMKKLIS